jgi:wyosine [tRNA(Phe)-imidazoG37] synthetase (radical SAM superfamily)
MRLPETAPAGETAFGCPVDFFDNRFVHAVVEPRARGLALGIDLNPDKTCNFDCVYCEIDRTSPPRAARLDVNAMAFELAETLAFVRSPAFRQRPTFRRLPAELFELRHVALSGGGEPTLSPVFVDAVESVVHVRACRSPEFFKIVLVTNGAGLDLPEVRETLGLFNPRDEIWIKLDAGTDQWMARANRPDCTIEELTDTIIRAGRARPIVIQSLFPGLDGPDMDPEEINAYIRRLARVKKSGARVSAVQISSAAPSRASDPPFVSLSLKCLSSIARSVREIAGLPAEVF